MTTRFLDDRLLGHSNIIPHFSEKETRELHQIITANNNYNDNN